MLQQTRMEVVLPYYERFLARFPTLADLATATDQDVTTAWSGLGYYRRARMLRAAAAEVMGRFGGTVPERVQDLLTLPGIGRYTAGAIASIAFNRPAPIVDGNVARIVARLFAIDSPLGSPALEREVWVRATELVEACRQPRHFNQGLMEIGALVCRPRDPSCGSCPLRELCAARASGLVEELPRPKSKPRTRAMRIDLYVIRDRRGRVLMRRERGPLMDGLTHLPHGDSSLLSGTPLPVELGALLGAFRHSITTRRIEFSVWAATLADPGRRAGCEYLWVEPALLHEQPHASYVRKALKVAGWEGWG